MLQKSLNNTLKKITSGQNQPPDPPSRTDLRNFPDLFLQPMLKFLVETK